MPELPEVETIVRKLQVVLPGKTVKQLLALHPKTIIGKPELIVGNKIVKVSRRAKIIRLHFDRGQNILIHLKMTGQLIYVDGATRIGGGHPTTDWVTTLPSKHTRAIFEFTTGQKLFFNDQRLFGWLKIMSNADVAKEFAKLAPDVIDDAFSVEYVTPKLAKRGQNIKQLLMDTTIVSGIGNIYVCDLLNLAKIHPERPAKSLTIEEIKTIVRAAKAVISTGIELGGTTFDGKYVDIDGLAGRYQSAVRVYGREGQPCLNCQSLIVKTKLGGRGTYFCQVCQV